MARKEDKMDEQLLKRSVQSIEMPEDMKDRIIENCRSGEAKPLFTPKKRLVYMPMAVTACVCVLVVALAGVGIWQMKTLSEGGSPTEGTHDIGTQEDVINVIPISDEDLDTMVPAYKSGYYRSEIVDAIDNLVTMTEEEINEYYGIDTAYLLSGLNIKLTPIDPAEVDGITYPYVFRTDGGWGETYYDTNAFTYGEDGEICVYISKFAVPYSIPKLWSDKEQLSTISGVTAAVGRREDGDWQKLGGGKYQYRVEFERKLEQDTLYFNVWCDYDMISKVVSEIKYKCDSSYSWGVPDPGITDADVDECLKLIAQNSDFTAVDSDIYDIDFDGSDEVLVLADVPFRAICVFEKENGKMVQTDTFGMGSLSGVETLKLHTYSDDDEKYPFFIFHYDNGGAMKCDVVAAIKPADGSYTVEYLLSFGTLTYTDIPEPFTKEFYRIGWNKTDIAMDGDYNDISKEEFLELYAKYRVYEPLTLEKLREICSGDPSTLSWSDFEQFECREIGSGLYILEYNIDGTYTLLIGGVPEDEPGYMIFFALMAEEQGIDIREGGLEDYLKRYISENAPAAYGSLIWPTDGGCIGEWGHWDGGYYGHTGIDISGIETGAPVYAGADGVVAYAGWKANLGYYVEIYHPDLGITSCYAHNSVIYVSEGQQVTQGERIAGAGSTGVAYGTCVHIAVKVNGENVNPRKYLSHIPEGDPYGGKDKETYQDPAEFVFGIQHIIQESATVEKMYKALAEFDTEGRIDKVLLSFDGKPVTDGRIVQGLYCEVYYDNEASWFSFNI